MGSLVVNCDAVTDNTHLREQKRGLYLDGELGGLALGARDGIVVEWEVKAVMDRLYTGGCRLRMQQNSPQASETKEAKKGNSKFTLQQVNFLLTYNNLNI